MVQLLHSYILSRAVTAPSKYRPRKPLHNPLLGHTGHRPWLQLWGHAPGDSGDFGDFGDVILEKLLELSKEKLLVRRIATASFG